MQINLEDNQDHLLVSCINNATSKPVTEEVGMSVISDLQFLEHKQVRELLRHDNADLFVMANEDKIEDEYIFRLSDTEYKNCRISTGNIVGFIGYNDTQVSISSRFSDSDDFFLHYMLARVLNINLSDLEHGQQKSNLFDFLILLFPYYLRRAFSKGIFRQYKRNSYNDTNIKGTINVIEYIKKDIPFNGKIAYSKRDYAEDNNLTELVRHTIEYIQRGRYKAVLDDSVTSRYVREILVATKSYDKSRCAYIVSKNNKLVRHPYYSEWTDLQKLCLMILNHHKIKYSGNNARKIRGILIDVAWLWEEYLHRVLKPFSFKHPMNKAKKNHISLFQDFSGKRYPDFYNDYYVLDAKYKRLGQYPCISEIGRDDIHQMISYMHVLQPKKETGIFLFPVKENVEKIALQGKMLRGFGGIIRAEGLIIPSCQGSFERFVVAMHEQEEAFLERLSFEV